MIGAAPLFVPQEMKNKITSTRVQSLNFITSLITGVYTGKSSIFLQSGISSLSARGSKTFPDKICAPIYDPYDSLLISLWDTLGI